jgi:hypothetical protein
MKNKLLTIGIFLGAACFAVTGLSATKNIDRKPNQAQAATFQLKVVYGDKTTFFKLSRGNGDATASFSTNVGTHSSKTISLANYDYLKLKVDGLSGVSNEKNFCARKYIDLRTDSKEFVGCLGASNKLARDIQEIANLAALLF